MTSCPSAPLTPRSRDSFWLTRHQNRFLESLAAQGYAESTLSTFRRLTDRLCAEARARGLQADDFKVDVLRELAATCPRTGTPYREQELVRVARRFTGYLTEAGVMDPVTPPPPAPGSPEQLGLELDH